MLNDTRVSDAGIYRCMVNNPPETPDPGIGELELSVVGTWAPPGQLKVSVALRPQDRTNDEILFCPPLQLHRRCRCVSGTETSTWGGASRCPARWRRGPPLQRSAGLN